MPSRPTLSLPLALLVQACLADPEFMAYVGRVELAWVELEQEMGLAP